LLNFPSLYLRGLSGVLLSGRERNDVVAYV